MVQVLLSLAGFDCYFFLCGEFECVQRVLQIWIWGGGGVVCCV